MTQCSGWQSPGWSNPNLLVNWDFRNPVNQRGQTSYTTETNIVYSLDCWQIGGNGSLNIEDGYIRVFRKIDFENMFQKIEKTSELAGKTITFSVCMGGQANMTLNVNNNYPAYAFKREEGIEIVELSYTLPEDLNNLEVIIQPPEDNTSFDLYAVKLEVGSISTLALDLMQPSDYAAELRKCQRYFYSTGGGSAWSVLARGFTQNTNDAYVSIQIPVPMRVSPSIQWGGEMNISTGGRSNKVNSIRLNQFTDEYVGLIATTEGLISEQYVELMKNNDSNAFLWLSAEL